MSRCGGPETKAGFGARAEMVARLYEEGALDSGLLRDACFPFPGRSGRRGGTRWTGLRPVAATELLGALYGGESVLIQYDGEPLLGRVPNPRSRPVRGPGTGWDLHV
ncbi:hypothetical protein GCM10010211_37640 [Streptomyces albospinus]|uniref:Uncharacterized protein n=1 Tax=Streptomyces albospinus TaxID=285515 RepID=A0ABQ2V4K8_9ACTN|nr:hypothetical protein GCM10010211_37640 [Streptomyces albospinus]